MSENESCVEFVRPGAVVKLGPDADIEAVVLAVCLRGTTVSYEVAWWDGRSRRNEWVADSEITSKEPDVVGVGFR